MGVKVQHNLDAISRQFRFSGRFVSANPVGAGHINDTYCATFEQDGTRPRYILQRINHQVFKNPVALMENVRNVTEHVRRKGPGSHGADRAGLTLVPTLQDQAWHQDAAGNYWRAYHFIEGARSYDTVQSERQAFEAARIVGRFQSLLVDLPAVRLYETIPDFHNTPKRFDAFEQALKLDLVQRAALAGPEIGFALRRRDLCNRLLGAGLPMRVTHNDTKLNNILFDEQTGDGLCVVDLDTVMPGLSLYDFGDMVRATTCSAQEDERDLNKVEMDFRLFEALARGYLAATRDWLTVTEKRLLAASGMVITFELGLRFLTDFLNGDTYFKVHREGHNLDRCRTQFKLVESIERQQARMERLVETL